LGSFSRTGGTILRRWVDKNDLYTKRTIYRLWICVFIGIQVEWVRYLKNMFGNMMWTKQCLMSSPIQPDHPSHCWVQPNTTRHLGRQQNKGLECPVSFVMPHVNLLTISTILSRRSSIFSESRHQGTLLLIPMMPLCTQFPNLMDELSCNRYASVLSNLCNC
jgi:hypothetical protein